MNKNHYIDQIDIISTLSSIQKSFSIEANETSSTTQKSGNLNIEDFEFNSDEDDDYFDNENQFYKNDNNDAINDYNQLKKQVIETSQKVFTKKSKVIFLINDSNIQCNRQTQSYLNQSPFIKEFFSQTGKDACKVHLIDVNDSLSYQSFLTSLNEFSIESNYLYEDVQKNLRFTQLSQMSNSYIKLKNSSSWKTKLIELIKQRYSILEINDSLQFNSLAIHSKLKTEIQSILFPFDEEFIEACNLILSEIKTKINTKNREVFISELEISSKENLNIIRKFNDSEFLPIEKVDNIKNSHVAFLKEEFFSIIKNLSPQKSFNSVYEDNLDVLNEQIEKDSKEISDRSKEAESNIEKLRETKNMNNEYLDGTNVTIRQAENVREIKVEVEINSDLKGIIDQDF